MQNIEFKAELRNLEAARRQCSVLGAAPAGVLRQVDVYYRLTDGRLKKRATEGQPIEWVFYHRPDRVSPRMSNYTILTDEQARRRWGTHSLREWLTVSKVRELWLLNNIRIHLDVVEALGTFIEFEAVVSRTCDVKQCHESIAALRKNFHALMGEPIAMSYSDLMQQAAVEN